MNTQFWQELDKKHCWHPFTSQAQWTDIASSPLMLESGQGVWLTDTDGVSYIDGNSSIWTNIHGHNHPVLNQALTDQLAKVAHTSYLGFGHPLASALAERLCRLFPEETLERCFFSDDGSTAMEVAMKMSIQYRLQNGQPNKVGFISFNNAYHGDTMGAASLGGVSLFFDRFNKLGLPSYRVNEFVDLEALDHKILSTITALVIEPMIQGVNQMTPWPEGLLKQLRAWADRYDIHLIFDEVMTGFGRTGKMFACHHEGVIPDFLCCAKGITGGYMPMAATLTTEKVYEAFLGEKEKAFYYGHSYTANPLGCSVALASLDLFETEQTLQRVNARALYLSQILQELLSPIAYVYEVRQLGLIVGIELRQQSGDRWDPSLAVGKRVAQEAMKYQFLTRPILDTLVLMPPLVISEAELLTSVTALQKAIVEVCEVL